MDDALKARLLELADDHTLPGWLRLEAKTATWGGRNIQPASLSDADLITALTADLRARLAEPVGEVVDETPLLRQRLETLRAELGGKKPGARSGE